MILFLMLAQVDSLSIEQAIDIALSQSPTYHESKASLDKSHIQFYQALSNVLPTLSAGIQYSIYENNGHGTGPYSGQLSLTQPLLDLDIISSILVSRRQLKSNGLQYTADIAELILTVKTAYYDLIYENELLKSSEIAIRRAKENMDIITAKYKVGAVSKLDKLQAEVFHLSVLQDQAKAKTRQIAALEELKIILAACNDIFPTDSLIPPNEFDFPSIDSLIAILGEANYNIQVAEESENIARLEVISSYLAVLPRVSLYYGYTYSSDELIFDFQQWNDISTKNYGISISFPIFEIRSLIFNNLNARKELDIRKFEKQRLALESEKSLHTTYYGLCEAYDMVQYAAKSLGASTEAAKIAREQYTLGIISFLELLTAEEDAYDAQVSYTSAISDFYTQRASLSYLLGGSTFD